MRSRERPADYPTLTDYKPTRFMLPTSHYDKEKADRAVRFVEMLPHTKGEWEGQPFWLLPWQEQIIRDIFGVVKEDGLRQFRTAYIEIPKKMGKSELAAAITLYLLYADNEPSAEVFSAAADRAQASIVYDVAKRMVEMTPARRALAGVLGGKSWPQRNGSLTTRMLDIIRWFRRMWRISMGIVFPACALMRYTISQIEICGMC